MGHVRLAGLGALMTALLACDGKLDQVAVDKGTGIFRGWDRSVCECDFEIDAWDTLVVDLYCAPLFDGKDGYGGTLYLDATPVNQNTRTLVWTYEGLTGSAMMEVTSETAEHDGDVYRAVFVDWLDVPEQDACSEHIGGYGDYYIYEECIPFAGGRVEGVRAWCRELSGGYY